MEFILKEFEQPVKVTKLAHLHYFEFTNNYHTLKDRHDFCELVYVDSGRLDIISDRYNGCLEQHQMILHLPNDAHALSCDKNIAPEVIIISFGCECSRLSELAFAPVTLSAAEQKLLAEIIREGMTVFAPPYGIPNMREMNKRKEYPFGADQMIKNLLEEFLIRLIRGSEKKKRLTSGSVDEDTSMISEIKKYIAENLKEHITISELCLLFNTNKTTLHNEFKAETGDTIVGYMNKLRIHEAKKLMREKNMNFSQIAEYLGFSSVHYFSRVFKQYENSTPSEYTETIRSNLMLDKSQLT